MKINGYKQVNGKWIAYVERVSLYRYLKHLYYGYLVKKWYLNDLKEDIELKEIITPCETNK